MNTTRVTVAGPIGELVGTYLPPQNTPDFAVVWLHGLFGGRSKEKAVAMCTECTRRGWAFAAFDLRGHGESSGTKLDLSPSGFLEDLAAVRDWLAQRGHTRIGLVGTSMGGFVSAWFAKRYPKAVVGCVLLAPAFNYLSNYWNGLPPEKREEWQRTGRLHIETERVTGDVGFGLVAEREQFRSCDLARGWDTPTLIFHGLADTTVPYPDSLCFVQNVEDARVELRLLKDNHRLLTHMNTITAATGAFFADLLDS
jgi:uncharacterized protein